MTYSDIFKKTLLPAQPEVYLEAVSVLLALTNEIKVSKFMPSYSYNSFFFLLVLISTSSFLKWAKSGISFATMKHTYCRGVVYFPSKSVAKVSEFTSWQAAMSALPNMSTPILGCCCETLPRWTSLVWKGLKFNLSCPQIPTGQLHLISATWSQAYRNVPVLEFPHSRHCKTAGGNSTPRVLILAPVKCLYASKLHGFELTFTTVLNVWHPIVCCSNKMECWLFGNNDTIECFE